MSLGGIHKRRRRLAITTLGGQQVSANGGSYRGLLGSHHTIGKAGGSQKHDNARGIARTEWGHFAPCIRKDYSCNLLLHVENGTAYGRIRGERRSVDAARRGQQDPVSRRAKNLALAAVRQLLSVAQFWEPGRPFTSVGLLGGPMVGIPSCATNIHSHTLRHELGCPAACRIAGYELKVGTNMSLLPQFIMVPCTKRLGVLDQHLQLNASLDDPRRSRRQVEVQSCLLPTRTDTLHAQSSLPSWRTADGSARPQTRLKAGFDLSGGTMIGELPLSPAIAEDHLCAVAQIAIIIVSDPEDLLGQVQRGNCCIHNARHAEPAVAWLHAAAHPVIRFTLHVMQPCAAGVHT